MPKRVPTPPPADDEPKYFSILNPWPPNANMELAGDMHALASWLDAMTQNTAALLAIFHKPSSPRLIILEVSRDYEDHRKLLGQHFWGGPNGFLEDPTTAEDLDYSAIFYCFYTSAREVEKHGWKRKWFEEDMFVPKLEKSNPKSKSKPKPKKLFKDPYPVTTYIQLPVTDPTAQEFCRRLPLNLFPEANPNKKKTSGPPVGSSSWAVKEQGPSVITHEPTDPIGGEGSVTAISDAVVQSPVEAIDELERPPNSGADEQMSDLPIASQVGGSDQDRHICPWHGIVCKKMCEWRTENDRKYPQDKSEGPSNIKNYIRNSGGPRGRKNRPQINTSHAERSHSESGTTSPSAAGRAMPIIRRAPPPPTRANPPSSGNQANPGAVSPNGVPTSPTAGRGVSNGPVRGAPAWSSRRGRGRAL